MDKERIIRAIAEIIEAIGEDPERPGLRGTPERVADMFEDILSGDKRQAEEVLSKTHELDHNEMVIVRDIPFYSMCEHHLLPFYGKAHIAYIPRENKITGISKLARLVESVASRLQLQERLTEVVADMMVQNLDPLGAMVVIEAQHMCMIMRGVKKPGSKVITSAMRGIFLSDARTRAEALALINRKIN